MRVIGGSAKGTRLAPVPPGTRPLSDRAREGLFSSLAAVIPDAVCGDLFAGTGAVGIEALSRGAASCLFVDYSTRATRAIEENLTLTKLEGRARVVRSDVRAALEREEGPFDVAFLDPPYEIDEGELASVLGLVAARLGPDGRFALTRPKGKDSMNVIPLHWHSARLLSYGDARIHVCRRQN
ncbi:MAG: RsmD family RNA methyltransferase [Actinomycetota bacterium]